MRYIINTFTNDILLRDKCSVYYKFQPGKRDETKEIGSRLNLLSSKTTRSANVDFKISHN